MENIFNNPKYYLDDIYNNFSFSDELLSAAKSEYKGLSMMCAWITKKCPLHCDKCFFKSNMITDGMCAEEYNLTENGIERLIKFVNDSNSGYLMLSGGGDPMVCPEKVNRIVQMAETKRIVIVTSGFWAKDYEYARTMIRALYQAYMSRTMAENCSVILRLSIDEFHALPLGGIQAYLNIINIFNSEYADAPGFELLIHTMRGDSSVSEVCSVLHGKLAMGEWGESDNDKVIKIVPQKATMYLPSGYNINIGISKLFFSDLLIDLRQPYSQQVQEAIKVMTDDIENSEQDNPSYIQNALGKKGLDFWVDYNGNITTWFNQDRYKLYNLYTDTYDDVVNGTFNNPITARFLKKGYQYRNSIVASVDSLAVLRSKAINLRDYAAAFLLEEDKTKLYFAVRSLQDYINEFILQKIDFNQISATLRNAIFSNSMEVATQYYEANYDVTDQYLKEDTFDAQSWEDIFMLIALGHYHVNAEKLEAKIHYYNTQTGLNIVKVNDFIRSYNDSLYSRMHNRISFMKLEAYLEVTSQKGLKS